MIALSSMPMNLRSSGRREADWQARRDEDFSDKPTGAVSIPDEIQRLS